MTKLGLGMDFVSCKRYLVFLLRLCWLWRTCKTFELVEVDFAFHWYLEELALRLNSPKYYPNIDSLFDFEPIVAIVSFSVAELFPWETILSFLVILVFYSIDWTQSDSGQDRILPHVFLVLHHFSSSHPMRLCPLQWRCKPMVKASPVSILPLQEWLSMGSS